MALKSLNKGWSITGFGRNPATLEKARQIGCIDHIGSSLAEAVAQAQWVILCTPVGRLASLLRELAPLLKAGTIVTDVGSTKASVARAAARWLPSSVHFVASHPMAGSEKRGPEYARTDLFDRFPCIVTPTARTNPDALRQVLKFWTSLGMRVYQLSPARHDRLLADISHLPHVLAAALVRMQTPQTLELAGNGFLDTTRIAAGDGELWRDILLDNRVNLRHSLQKLRKQLDQLLHLLEPHQSDPLADWLNQAAQKRAALAAKKLKQLARE